MPIFRVGKTRFFCAMIEGHSVYWNRPWRRKYSAGNGRKDGDEVHWYFKHTVDASFRTEDTRSYFVSKKMLMSGFRAATMQVFYAMQTSRLFNRLREYSPGGDRSVARVWPR